MQTETLLLVLLTTGMLIVLVLTSATLWVLLTILFKVRRAMNKTKKVADSGLAVLKFLKPSYAIGFLAALAAMLKPDKEEAK